MDEYTALIAGIFIGIVLVILVPFILFLMTLQRALSRCAPQNRTMQPGEVWLMLVPLLNIVWQFLVVSRVATSMENEFRSRNIPKDLSSAKGLGIAMCVMTFLSILPIIGFLGFLGCWIAYWATIGGLSKELVNPTDGLLDSASVFKN